MSGSKRKRKRAAPVVKKEHVHSFYNGRCSCGRYVDQMPMKRGPGQ